MTRQSSSAVEVAVQGDGITFYLVSLPPEALPPVRMRDLSAAWDAARGAASASRWDAPRMFRFRRTSAEAQESDGDVEDGCIELALADPDACCWAGAVDRTLGLASAYGISVCLRLLALVDLLASAPWAMAWCELRRDGADIDQSLLRAAAAMPLTAYGLLDEASLRAKLPRAASMPGQSVPYLSSGAPA